MQMRLGKARKSQAGAVKVKGGAQMGQPGDGGSSKAASSVAGCRTPNTAPAQPRQDDLLGRLCWLTLHNLGLVSNEQERGEGGEGREREWQDDAECRCDAARMRIGNKWEGRVASK